MIMGTYIGPLKTETDKMDQNPLITTNKHDVLIILCKASLFRLEMSALFVALKNETVG